MLATTKGKKKALKALEERRKNPPRRVENASLIAGSPMYYYCISCGYTSDVLPECHISKPTKLCTECAALNELGWLE